MFREEIIETVWKGLVNNFGISDTDLFTDGSSVKRESDKGELSGQGHPRDNNPDGMQTEFTVAMLADSRIPFYLKPFKGNVSDEQQYAECIPEMLGLIDKGELKAYKGLYTEWKSPAERGKREMPSPMLETDKRSFADLVKAIGEASWVIVDNGGASNYNTTLVALLGHNYLTRKPLNASDIDRIMSRDDEVQVEEGLWCIEHEYESSGRTTYLFFSQDLKDKKMRSIERRVRKQVEVAQDVAKGHIDRSRIYTQKKNPFLDVTITLNVQSHITEFTDDDVARMIEKGAGETCGFFKLEASQHLTPLEVIRMYRKRAVIEQLIGSLKNNTGIKPMRVWREFSVSGDMMLSFLCEFSIACARFQLTGEDGPEASEKAPPKDSKTKDEGEIRPFSSQDGKPSTKFLIRSLSHLTATFVKKDEQVSEVVYSNWDSISKRIYAVFNNNLSVKT